MVEDLAMFKTANLGVCDIWKNELEFIFHEGIDELYKRWSNPYSAPDNYSILIRDASLVTRWSRDCRADITTTALCNVVSIRTVYSTGQDRVMDEFRFTDIVGRELIIDTDDEDIRNALVAYCVKSGKIEPIVDSKRLEITRAIDYLTKYWDEEVLHNLCEHAAANSKFGVQILMEYCDEIGAMEIKAEILRWDHECKRNRGGYCHPVSFEL